jgi:hypothetical protein
MTREAATTLVNYEWTATFSGCTNLTMGENFTFDQDAWSGVTTVMRSFAFAMFSGCSGNSFTMNEIFNLPQDLETVGYAFMSYMFSGCSGNSFTMNDVFNIPQGITAVDYSFVESIFANCYGNSFNMNAIFNFPQSITGSHLYFATYMFDNCHGNSFTMNNKFNLPQGIKSANHQFARQIFNGCSGINFTMNSVFNLPQGITTVGIGFAYSVFGNCRGDKFTMNDVFNIPQGITVVDTEFADRMFYNCIGAAFQVNAIFKLTPLSDTELQKTNVYYQTFYLSNGTTTTATTHQTRSALDILNGNEIDDDSGTQSNGKQTFGPYTDDTVWDGLCSIQKYFGGFGENACFMLHYDRNGGTGGTNLATQVCMVGEACNLAPRQAWRKDDDVTDLNNWYSNPAGTGGDDYAYGLNAAGVSYFAPATVVTLYAKWTELSLTLSVEGGGTINIGSLTPGGGGNADFGYGSAKATVTTNNPTGWSLSFSATETGMQCTTPGITATIPTITSQGTLSANSWGWNWSTTQPAPTKSSQFKPVATGANPITDSASPTPTGTDTYLYFGAYAGMNTTACTYNNTITVTAVAPL